MLKTSRTISHVRQTKNSNCVPACLAMVTGENIEEIEKELENRGFAAPFSANAFVGFLTRRSIYVDKISNTLSFSLFPNTVYLATTPSKTVSGAFHMVCIVVYEDSARVFDPSDNLEEETLYSFDQTDGMIPCFEFFHLTDFS